MSLPTRPSTSPREQPQRRVIAATAAAAATAILATPGTAQASLPPAGPPAPGPPAAPATPLHEGSRGIRVVELRRALHLRPTGRFDATMRRAVVRFQEHHHLAVDGLVGVQTWDRVFHIQPPASSGAPAAPAPLSGPAGYTIPAAIVQCESGGSYTAVNSQTGAGGAYQILPSTWAAYGGQGLPENAPPAEQNRIAAEIYATQGPSAWSC